MYEDNTMCWCYRRGEKFLGNSVVEGDSSGGGRGGGVGGGVGGEKRTERMYTCTSIQT